MSSLKKWQTAAVVLALVVAPSVVRAEIIKADFAESLDLPDPTVGSSIGPRLLLNLGVALPSTGPQLTAANTIANPSSWNDVLNVTFDATTNILSLTADDSNVYQDITVTLSNLLFSSGEKVIGITPITLGSAVTPDTAAPTVGTSFTDTSFIVSYTVTGSGHGQFSINPAPAADTFQVTLGATATVPEPATSVISVSTSTLVLLGYALRRRKSANA